MAKLGFIGLGLMGAPMARNLIRAGHDVALWSHTPGKAEGIEGGHACSSPAEVGKHGECTFICVGNTAMAQQVILGELGILAGAAKGSVVVDASTISPSASKKIHAELAAAGIDFLGAPCTGSTPGAINAALTFMVGGEQRVFDRVLPWFEAMGKKIYFCGGPGMGLHAKLSQNLVLSNLMEAFNEAIVLSTKAGVDPLLMLDILSNSAAKSGLVEYKAPFILDRNFETNFSVKWMHKDVELMLESGRELGVPLELTTLTERLFRKSIDRGDQDEDFCSTIKNLEAEAGITVERKSSK